MTTFDPTDEQLDRLRALREELAAHHAGTYARVTDHDALTYLLDLGDAVDDPERDLDIGGAADAGATADGTGDSDDLHPAFPRERLHERLAERNLRHGSNEESAPADLYSIAATFDVTGRSDMTKAELVEAILDAAERRYYNPFTDLDVAFPDPDGEEKSDHRSADNEPGRVEGNTTNGGNADTDEDASDEDANGGSQLDAMMSLLDTHADKWREGDGDARYEVDLPDGATETARTKDDVRALLFRHY